MNELIIIGILSMIFSGICIVAKIVENFGAILDWLFDVQTFYYKFRSHRRRKKNAKDYYLQRY